MERYRVQVLHGYTDGRPSWRMVMLATFWSKQEAENKASELRKRHPHGKYRVRKLPARKR